MRIVDDLFRQRVPAFAIARRDPDAQRIGVDVCELVLEVSLLLVKEGLAVRDQKLHVTDLRPVDRRVINLVQNAVRDRVPRAARRGIGRTYRVLRR